MAQRWHSMEGGITSDEFGNWHVFLEVTLDGIAYMQWRVLPRATRQFPELFGHCMDMLVYRLDIQIKEG